VNVSGRLDISEVKTAASGQWPMILTAAGIPQERLNGGHHACPKCGGTDRFRLIDAGAGAVLCSQCFNERNGDGLAAVQWIRGCNFPLALRFVAEQVGIAPKNGHTNGHSIDPLDAICRAKRMPRDGALIYGGRITDGAVAFPSWGPAGEPLSEFTIWPNGNEKRKKGLWPKGGTAGIFLPVVDGTPQLPQPGETWIVCEGVKDAAALHALGYLAAGLNTCQMAQRFAPMFRGVKVVLAPDRDTASIEGMDKSAGRLHRVTTSTRIAALPAEVTSKDGKDVRDILGQQDGERLVRLAIEQAQEWTPPKSDDPSADNRVRIFAGPKEHEVATEAIKALAGLDGLYQRGGNLVSVVTDPDPPKGIIRPPGSLYLNQIDEPGLCDRLSQVAQFFQRRRQGEELVEVDVPPPLRIAKIIQSRRNYPAVSPIEGIVHAPTFLADGSVLTTKGYDRRTGLYLAGAVDFPAVPQSPTLADAETARDEILEVVCDFPFANDAHKAAWLALALTPAARFAFDGPSPLGAFDSNVRGSGKSKAADSIAMIHLGTDMPRTAYPDSDDELRKAITAALLASELMMLLDNVARMLGGPALDALLTATGWNERILGQSKLTGRLTATTLWLASGNNLVFGADTSRRSLACRLESREENPEERQGFKHPDLLGWVKQNRGRLAVAAVTILRAYHVDGRPKLNLNQWGSFEGWSNLVRNAVVWCGMEDPGATRQEVREQSDREAGLLRQLLAAWESADPSGYGMTVAEAIRAAADGNQLLQDAFSEIGTPGKPPNPRSIGMKLHHMRGRVAGGKHFDRRTNSTNTVIWRVEGNGTTCSTGTIANPLTRARAHAHAHAHTQATELSPCSPTSPIEEALF
jgi:primase-helicase-like zinc-binding protein